MPSATSIETNRVYWSGLGWWSFGQGSTSAPWGEKFTRPRVSKEYKEWVTRQYELYLDSSLTNKEFVYKELDEKIMLGLRLKEGIDCLLYTSDAADE